MPLVNLSVAAVARLLPSTASPQDETLAASVVSVRPTYATARSTKDSKDKKKKRHELKDINVMRLLQ
ncbi:hypothetical protein H9P43_004145 [Blastocladiella emersonii ATCC 22665]|nr:hypothetical protein H9P43_004145 [Blastocladiella emersonii ATCC 22665]